MRRNIESVFIIFTIVLFGLSAVLSPVFANTVCSSGSPACVPVYTQYCWTRTFECSAYPGGPLTSTCTDQQCEMRSQVCSIPQAGGGSCICCWNDGCYLDCGVIPPTGGGGPTDPPADPPPPGSTSTPVPTSTPITLGTIQARAVQVTQADTSCTAIRSVPTTAGQINNTILQFTRSSASAPPAQMQSGANYVTFANILTGWYTVDSILPTIDWMYSRACWNNLTTGTTGEGLSQTLGANQTIAWDIGYTLGTAWLQTQGGDVYASGNVRSYIPNVTPRVFSRDGTGGYSGIVTYGTSYDLDSSPLSTGGTLVSSTNWQVNATQTAVDYYDYFYRRFDSPTATDNDSFPNLLSVAKPASRAKPYYIAGDMTTFGDWTVTTGENIVFIVTGNVTIGGKINITGDGFAAFIVNGNIKGEYLRKLFIF